jgi:hypothetical protein
MGEGEPDEDHSSRSVKPMTLLILSKREVMVPPFFYLLLLKSPLTPLLKRGE